MNEQDFELIVDANTPFLSGDMVGSIIYEHNPFFSRASFDAGLLPYIKWQNEGFIHYITKKPVTVNKGFIENKIVGAINRNIQADVLGLPPSRKEYNDVLADRQNQILVSKGVVARVI